MLVLRRLDLREDLAVAADVIGQALIRQKGRLPHGMFLKWVDAEFEFSRSSAHRFMNVARVFGDKFTSLGNLGVEALDALAAPSTPESVRSEVEMSASSAENFMRVARKFSADEFAKFADLKPSAIYELAASPESVRSEVEALLVDGQKVTLDDIKRQAFPRWPMVWQVDRPGLREIS